MPADLTFRTYKFVILRPHFSPIILISKTYVGENRHHVFLAIVYGPASSRSEHLFILPDVLPSSGPRPRPTRAQEFLQIGCLCRMDFAR